MTEPAVPGCTGKEAFERGNVARKVAQRMSSKGRKVEAYRCDVCPCWHVGTRPKSPRFGKDGQRLKPRDPRFIRAPKE